MAKVLYAHIFVLALLLTYTIYSQDLKIVEEKEYQKSVVIYTKAKCKFCISAQELLRKNGILYADIDITWDKELHQKLINQTGQKTVPYIFIQNEFIGGYSELLELSNSKKLTIAKQ
jgi:glutaredoxin 3